MWTNVKTPHASLVDKKATQALIQLVKRPGIPLRLATLKIKKKVRLLNPNNELLTSSVALRTLTTLPAQNMSSFNKIGLAK